MKTFKILFVCFFLQACSTYSKRQCIDMDWQQAASLQALDGKTLDAINRHFNKECLDEYGVQVDEVKIQTGYAEGVKALCTYRGGLDLGTKALPYNRTCSPETETSFMQGYQTGSINFLSERVYNLEQEIRKRDEKISELQREIESLKRQQNHSF